jgi:hypothetical protein
MIDADVTGVTLRAQCDGSTALPGPLAGLTAVIPPAGIDLGQST